MAQQQYLDPFLAIVVDPHRTIAAGKVEIGAFRTFPEVPKTAPAKSLYVHIAEAKSSAKTWLRST